MPLLLSMNGFENQVQAILFTLAQAYVGGVGTELSDIDDPLGGGFTYWVTFKPPNPGDRPMTPVEVFLDQVCNQTPNSYIVIYGEYPAFPIPATKFFSGGPLNQFGGLTAGPVNAADGNEYIYVFVDVSDCSGRHYHVYGKLGGSTDQEIIEPLASILCHELSHAYHLSNRDAKIGSFAEYEAQAIDDENLIRVQVGVGPRNPNNTGGGCGFSGKVRTFWQDACFVVTAAYGTDQDPAIRDLRSLRDDILRPTQVGGAIFEEFFEEYRAFSPRIAEDMAFHPALRSAIRTLMVDPLLDYLRLARDLCAASPQRDGNSRGREADLIQTGLERLNGMTAGGGASVEDEASDALAAIEALARELNGPTAISKASAGTPPTGEDVSCAEAAEYVGAVMLLGRRSYPMTQWALLGPLLSYWRALVAASRNEPTQMTADAERWVGEFPVLGAIVAVMEEVIDDDLSALARSAIANERVRTRVREHLLAATDRQDGG